MNVYRFGKPKGDFMVVVAKSIGEASEILPEVFTYERVDVVYKNVIVRR